MILQKSILLTSTSKCKTKKWKARAYGSIVIGQKAQFMNLNNQGFTGPQSTQRGHSI